LFVHGKSNINEVKENITDCAVELLQAPTYNIDSLKDEITRKKKKKRLDEKLGEGNFESIEECY
jgi:predicted nucleic acid-binding protein